MVWSVVYPFPSFCLALPCLASPCRPLPYILACFLIQIGCFHPRRGSATTTAALSARAATNNHNCWVRPSVHRPIPILILFHPVLSCLYPLTHHHLRSYLHTHTYSPPLSSIAAAGSTHHHHYYPYYIPLLHTTCKLSPSCTHSSSSSSSRQ